MAAVCAAAEFSIYRDMSDIINDRDRFKGIYVLELNGKATGNCRQAARPLVSGFYRVIRIDLEGLLDILPEIILIDGFGNIQYK